MLRGTLRKLERTGPLPPLAYTTTPGWDSAGPHRPRVIYAPQHPGGIDCVQVWSGGRNCRRNHVVDARAVAELVDTKIMIDEEHALSPFTDCDFDVLSDLWAVSHMDDRSDSRASHLKKSMKLSSVHSFTIQRSCLSDNQIRLKASGFSFLD